MSSDYYFNKDGLMVMTASYLRKEVVAGMVACIVRLSMKEYKVSANVRSFSNKGH
ncbi:MAG: hypothetical protein ACI8ZN_001993 [Bacteroidia bacterium]|jgi:hypothetical protein